MKKYITLLLVALFLGAGINTNAQILDRIGKKIEKKAADRLERKIDKTIDKGLDKTEEEVDKSVTKKPKSEKQADSNDDADQPQVNDEGKVDSSDPTGMLGAFMKKVDVKDSYSFNVSLTYLTTIISDKETMTMDYDFAMSDKGNGDLLMTINDMKVDGKSQMQDHSMSMIFDMENKAMISIMKKEKMYMPVSMDLGSTVEEQNEEQDYKISKTGKTKTVLGYSCEEYEVDSKETSGNIWVSTDSRLDDFDPFMAMNKASRNKGNSYPMMEVKGAVLEMNMTFKEAKKKSDPKTMQYIVTDIKDVNIVEDFKGLSNPMGGH